MKTIQSTSFDYGKDFTAAENAIEGTRRVTGIAFSYAKSLKPGNGNLSVLIIKR